MVGPFFMVLRCVCLLFRSCGMGHMPQLQVGLSVSRMCDEQEQHLYRPAPLSHNSGLAWHALREGGIYRVGVGSSTWRSHIGETTKHLNLVPRQNNNTCGFRNFLNFAVILTKGGGGFVCQVQGYIFQWQDLGRVDGEGQVLGEDVLAVQQIHSFC